MKTEHDIVAAFVVARLPDSLEERKRVLNALMAVLPRQGQTKATVFALLNLLRRHEDVQQNFAFEAGLEGPERIGRTHQKRNAPGSSASAAPEAANPHP